ncbi:MAG: M17 family peptidase N-terminal domain-containing protein [Microbacteriaceae bacterium]
MTVPALKSAAELAATDDADVLLLGVHSTEDGPVLASPAISGLDLVQLQGRLASIGVTGTMDEVRRLPIEGPGFASVALVGLGAGPVTPDVLRYASGSAARQLKGIESLSIALPTESEAEVRAVFEGAAIGSYAYVDYRVASLTSTKLPANSIAVISQVPTSENLIIQASIIAEAIHTVRDLVNTPPSDLYP